MTAAMGGGPTKLQQRASWRVKLNLFLLLIGPLYLVPCLLRLALLPSTAWLVSLLIADAFGCLFIAFLTNNLRCGALLYLLATVLEFSVAIIGHDTQAALWIGDAVPALVGVYFAQKLFVNMGD